MRHPARPRPARTRVPVLLIAGAAIACTHAANATAQARVASKLQPSGAKEDDVIPQLPANLKPVPGGTVRMGMDHDQLLELIKATTPYADETRKKRLIKISGNELGERQVDVPAFLMGEFPVTNREYLKFVEATGHRFPFHWWRFGEQDDYKSRQEEIDKQFEGKNASIRFWESRWKDLPYALKDAEGKDISDHPVVMVDRQDAMLYAAWAGARLPYETEWTRAARGDGTHRFVWGNHGEDIYENSNKATLKSLGIKSDRDAVLKPVGAMGKLATGPFGHGDMVGQVWEWMGDPQGVGRLCGTDSWKQAWRKATRDRDSAIRKLFGGVIVDSPSKKYVLKGSSYFGAVGNPFEFHIDMRSARSDDALFLGIGFRIAKSEAPAVDMARSLIQARYATGVLRQGQEPRIDNQLGIERYHLDQKGLIEKYEAASLVPLNHLMQDKKARLKNLNQDSLTRPFPVAVLALSGKAIQPALDQQLYTVLYRAEGMPEELVVALKEANRDLRKAAKKGAEVDGANADVIKWRKVLRKYGISEEEAGAPDAPKKHNFIRLPGSPAKIPTDEAALILVDNAENIAAVLPQKKTLKLSRKLEPVVVVGTDTGKGTTAGKETVEWTFGVPLNVDPKAKPAEFRLKLVLDSVPNPGTPWRR